MTATDVGVDLDWLRAGPGVIGMVHLPPLPGAPRYAGDRQAISERARSDARALEAGGVDGVLVENFGDAPFYPEDVPRHAVASMTALVRDVVEAVDVPVGVNVLRNDGTGAVAVAAAAGAAFVRVNVHAGVRVADQGLLAGRAHETLRLRDRIDADVAILADHDVKHSAPLAAREGDAEVAESVERGLADGVVVSGGGTGDPTAMADLQAVVDRRDELGGSTPVLVGSGVTADSVADYLAHADGVIVGTALKRGGETTAPVAAARVRELVTAARDAV
jgi:hypothetical protein